MIRKRQFSLFSVLVAITWIAIGLAVARYGWLSTSGNGIERRLVFVAAFAWAGAGFGLAEKTPAKSPFLGALVGVALGVYGQWQLFD